MFLNGRFANSAFCLLAPNGQDWLSRGGRGPEMSLGRGADAAKKLTSLAKKYPVKADLGQAVMQDFHSTRQALNVASADQRVLVLVNGSKAKLDKLRTSLRTVASDSQVIGRFHFDFNEAGAWPKTISGTKGAEGIALVQPGEFGLNGKVMQQLPLNADAKMLTAALTAANKKFAQTVEKKVYSQHVSKGRRLGIYFEPGVPYGEDRNGDGKIDGGGGRRPRGR